MNAGAAEAPARSAAPRFPLFDSLRAIAALSVLVLHLPLVIDMPLDHPLKLYLLELNVGVAIFFLISGFLLYRPFVQARYTGEAAPAAGLFAARRALRIIPPYWVALAAVVLLVGASGEAATASEVFTTRGVLSYFGFLQIYDSNTLLGGISAAWTLCVEVTFYAMLPLWAMLMSRVPWRSSRGFLRTELLGLGALFVIGVSWTSIAASRTDPTAAIFVDVTQIEPWLYVLPAYLDQFAAGMALAVLSVVFAGRATQPAPIRVIDGRPWLPWLVAALVFVLSANRANVFGENWGLRFIAAHELQALFAFALLLPAVFGNPDRGMVRKLLANRVLLWVGLVSYGVYLWHGAIILKLRDLGALETLGSIGFTGAVLGLTLAVAAASFYGIERRALRLGRRLSHRSRSQDADMRMRDLGRHEAVTARTYESEAVPSGAVGGESPPRASSSRRQRRS